MSSNARKIPAPVLAHPEVQALIETGTATGSVTPDQVRQASDAAQILPQHLKGLLAHLSALGVSVDVGATSTRAAAATSTAKKAAAKAPAKKAAAPAKKAAAKKSAARKSA